MRVPEIQLIPLREAVSTDRPTTLDLLIKIIPPELEEIIERPPLNIGLVLDRSGSMAGQKIEYVRQAAAYAVEQLLPTDRVSVTIYDDEIEALVPSTLAVDKVSIIRKIQRISDRGSTALHGGWVQGGIQVSQHLDSEHLNRVILLSDGLANVGETNPDVIASDYEFGTPPKSGTYILESDGKGLKITMTWETAEGQSIEMSYFGIPVWKKLPL